MSQSQQDERKCPNCGKLLLPREEICPYCKREYEEAQKSKPKVTVPGGLHLYGDEKEIEQDIKRALELMKGNSGGIYLGGGFLDINTRIYRMIMEMTKVQILQNELILRELKSIRSSERGENS